MLTLIHRKTIFDSCHPLIARGPTRRRPPRRTSLGRTERLAEARAVSTRLPWHIRAATDNDSRLTGAPV